MSKSSMRRALPGFKALAPSIYYQEASQPSSSASSTSSMDSTSAESPGLILLTSWTGADPRHIAKYTKRYNEVYPDTPIMIITTVIHDLIIRSTKEKIAALKPAIEFLRRHNTAQSKQPAILLHAFSEGGSNKAVCLAQAYLSATGCRLPIGAYVFDSTPGKPRFKSNVAAFKRSLPANKAVRAIGLPAGTVVLGIVYGTITVFMGAENNVISKTRKALNDETLWDVKDAPRTYVFSEADDLIAWEDVNDHARESDELLGLQSMVVRFKGSGHCNHAREDEEKYWTAILDTWEAREARKTQKVA
ncbi:indole-diterpene biosynthesis protein [Colletotrichum truncatum]|uniref:Indole-diterpene biosynthesis protein n=1 Tax=Colletotrichum truncatum TaxID=5467 RepID=A0ACC3YV00_COLTU|nr:indole-diterpene biosynthesis protein [Colletotrichum truncatum]KAF6781199.1 indole-diterpene biosynthesis protein [Colletotrichum truncatum]